MKNDELVSVVVPCYNISDYVGRCLRSLMEQTYDKIEIICIDDGSTDQTGEKLERYAALDSRINVIHDKNRGLSGARNFGVRQATGDYVTFVDGDDIVSPCYIQFLVDSMLEGHAEAAFGAFCGVAQPTDDEVNVQWDMRLQYEVVDHDDLIDRLLYDKPMISACAHLAPIDIYKENPFPEGRLYEDSLTFAKHIASLSRVALVSTPIYGYIRRRGSITDYSKSISARRADELVAALGVLDASISQEPEDHARALAFHFSLEMSRLYCMAVRISDDEAAAKRYKSESVAYVRKNVVALLGDRNVSALNKVRFCMLCCCPKMYPYALSLFNKHR